MGFGRYLLLLALLLFGSATGGCTTDAEKPTEAYRDGAGFVILASGGSACALGARVTEGQHLFVVYVEGNIAQRLKLEWPPEPTLKQGRLTSVVLDFGPNFRRTFVFSLLPTKYPMIVARLDDDELMALLHALADPLVPEMHIAFPDGETWHIRAPFDGRSLVSFFTECRNRARSGIASLERPWIAEASYF